MITKPQDLAWACLSEEARENIQISYKNICENNELDLKGLFDEVYGEHNLTSDSEVEKILVIPRKEIQEYFSWVNKIYNRTDRDIKLLKQTALKALFGDKCLSDKENPEPKYKVGDEVQLTTYGNKVGIIREIEKHEEDYYYRIEYHDTGKTGMAIESKIEPYTKPETKDMEEKLIIGTHIKYNGDEYATHISYDAPFEVIEEKELNLGELLKGCEGEQFYLLSRGYVTFKEIIYDEEFCSCSIVLTGKGRIELYTTGKEINNEAIVLLYPSLELYMKYPLDAYAAWMEWKESRKPKRWRAEKGGCFYMILPGNEISSIKDTYSDYCNDLYSLGNYFRIKEETQQAAEAVRKCLEEFHEKNNKIC